MKYIITIISLSLMACSVNGVKNDSLQGSWKFNKYTQQKFLAKKSSNKRYPMVNKSIPGKLGLCKVSATGTLYFDAKSHGNYKRHMVISMRCLFMPLKKFTQYEVGKFVVKKEGKQKMLYIFVKGKKRPMVMEMHKSLNRLLLTSTSKVKMVTGSSTVYIYTIHREIWKR